jgi:RNA polymerase sigma-70 factor (ECF subfamily)
MSKDGEFQMTTLIARDHKCDLDFEIYLDALYGYAMILSRSNVDAEDLVQETCMRAIQSKGRLRSDSNVKAWLLTILRNVWINQCRRPITVTLDAHPEKEVDNEVISTADPHTLFVVSEERMRVSSAVQRLPTYLRELILLREYEELSYQEIADVLHCPIGTVMSRLSRARSTLRAYLSE